MQLVAANAQPDVSVTPTRALLMLQFTNCQNGLPPAFAAASARILLGTTDAAELQILQTYQDMCQLKNFRDSGAASDGLFWCEGDACLKKFAIQSNKKVTWHRPQDCLKRLARPANSAVEDLEWSSCTC